jgi:hypothetical protein
MVCSNKYMMHMTQGVVHKSHLHMQILTSEFCTLAHFKTGN